MASAEECYQVWRGHFEKLVRLARGGDDLDARSHYGAIERPAIDVQIDSLTSISFCYQYFMLREGVVLMCTFSCCCPACFNVAVDGNIEGTRKTHLPQLQFQRALLHPCRQHSLLVAQLQLSAKTGAEASSPDKRARDRGYALAAAGISPGQWVLVEAYIDSDDEVCLEAYRGTEKCLRHALYYQRLHDRRERREFLSR